MSLNQVQAVSQSHPRRCLLLKEGCLMVHQAVTQSHPRRCLKREGCSTVQVQAATQSLQSRKELVANPGSLP